nr:hypothetical protein CFP56_66107 [Quercus suber]
MQHLCVHLYHATGAAMIWERSMEPNDWVRSGRVREWIGADYVARVATGTKSRRQAASMAPAQAPLSSAPKHRSMAQFQAMGSDGDLTMSSRYQVSSALGVYICWS